MIPTTQARPRTRRRVPPALVPVAASALALAWTGSALAAPPAINLDFSAAVAGTEPDKAGQGTGFTGVQNNTPDTERLPANLTLNPAGSVLSILTTLGDNKANNQQQNALQVSFDGTADYEVKTVLKGPFPINKDFQGAGIFVGPDQDNFVKLVINRNSLQIPQIELHRDLNSTSGVAGTAEFVKENSLPTAQKVALTLGVDAQTGAVVGSYSINDGPVKTVGPLALPLAVSPTAAAGILSTNFSSDPLGAPPVTFDFDRFSVTGATTPIVVPGLPGVPGAPGTVVPGQTSSGELCAPVKPTAAPPAKTPAKIKITSGQLLINQRISQAAVRRLNAVQEWLDDGIVRDDICGGALTAAKFGTGITATTTTQLTALTSASPRPVVEKKAAATGTSKVQVTAGQLLINQRISQAAVRRANALQERLSALTGGDIKDGQVSQAKLRQGVIITAATAATSPPAASKTVIAPRGSGGGAVKVEVGQLLIAQRIAQAALRRSNGLRDTLLVGLQSTNFRDASITAIDLASGTVRTP